MAWSDGDDSQEIIQQIVSNSEEDRIPTFIKDHSFETNIKSLY